ncbi:MAG: hypothetical protein RL199_213, partial [Pseudomonadota bacterium]
MLACLLSSRTGMAGERTEARLSAAISAAGVSSVTSRLRGVTDPLLGLPYIHSPLGEEAGTDPDPLVRYDGFDCLTFVETAMALAAARSLEDVPTLLADIRYGGAQRSFEGRNHFVEAQWVPRNLEKGWLRPAAPEVAGPHVSTASKAFGPRFFARRFRPEL